MTREERLTRLHTPAKAQALMEAHGIGREAAMMMIDYDYTLEAVRRWEALRWPVRPTEQGEQVGMILPNAEKPIPWEQRINGLMWRHGISRGAAILMIDYDYTLERVRQIDMIGARQRARKHTARTGGGQR